MLNKQLLSSLATYDALSLVHQKARLYLAVWTVDCSNSDSINRDSNNSDGSNCDGSNSDSSNSDSSEGSNSYIFK